MAMLSNNTGIPLFQSPAARTCLRVGGIILGYALLTTTAGLLFILDARTLAEIHFSETSRVEFAELVFLLLSLLGFAWGSGSDTRRRTLATLFCGLTLTAFIRELDWIMDDLVHGLWKAPAAAVILATTVSLWRNRTHLFPALAEFTGRSAWGLLTSGFLTIVIFSRLIGMKANWVAMLGHGAVMTSVKRAAEEGIELLGYTLIACGAWTFLLDRWISPAAPSHEAAKP